MTPQHGKVGGAWWQRLHHGLMPDYNRKATAYWWTVLLLGGAILGHALFTVASSSVGQALQVAAGVALAVLAGWFPVRVPGMKNSFAAADIVTFVLLLMFGAPAATLAAAAEVATVSWRTSKRWTSRLGSPAIAAVAMGIASSTLQAAVQAVQAAGLYNQGVLLLLTLGCAALNFLLSALLITGTQHLKLNRWPVWTDMLASFGWFGTTAMGSAAIAGLLFAAFQTAGIVVLLGAVPIMALLMASLHYFFLQQQANERTLQLQIEAEQREAALIATHLRELQASERRFHNAFAHAAIGMALVAADGRVLQANGALCRLLDRPADTPAGDLDLSRIVDPAYQAAFDADLAQLAAGLSVSFAAEFRLLRGDGSGVWASVHGSVYSEPGVGSPVFILQWEDTTERHLNEARLHDMAFHDSLTGLPNRRQLNALLLQASARLQADPQRHFSLLFLDFDRFKLINDSLGHTVGDELLVLMARRLRHHVRSQDAIARLGGDEFAILTDAGEGGALAAALASRLLVALREPFQVAGHGVTISASIGIASSQVSSGSPVDMLRDADTAMYTAKLTGKARYAVFEPGLHAAVSRRRRLEADLPAALAGGQIWLAYQPLYDLASRRLLGFEALARWSHPDLGAVGPDTFIPVAEEAGLMPQLTDFALQGACGELRRWHAAAPQFADLTMHINVSRNDLPHAGFVPSVMAALQRAGLAPRHLTLELTENILMEQLEAAMPVLEDLRRQGVSLSLDDFGTGSSSLRHLSGLPIDSLKIDRSFVANLGPLASEAAVIGAIVSMGRSLGRTVIAEGIETPAQATMLQELGCEAGQGFHFCHPLPPQQIDTLLADIAAGPPGWPQPQAPSPRLQ